jgi:hypothetical protein
VAAVRDQGIAMTDVAELNAALARIDGRGNFRID